MLFSLFLLERYNEKNKMRINSVCTQNTVNTDGTLKYKHIPPGKKKSAFATSISIMLLCMPVVNMFGLETNNFSENNPFQIIVRNELQIIFKSCMQIISKDDVVWSGIMIWVSSKVNSRE